MTISNFTTLYDVKFKDNHDTAIWDGMYDHLWESLEHFNKDQVVFIGLQGSQNYKLDTPTSDLDTKLIVVPSLEDLIFNRKAVSTTHVRLNNEHTDWKDIRLMFQTFRKQNLNFVEILYSPWVIVNQTYYDEILPLFTNKDLIGFYSKTKAVQTMKGIALNKYDAMEKQTPAHEAEMKKFGYSPKELHHLIRITDFMYKYTKETYTYEECLIPNDTNNLIWIKKGGLSLAEARATADRYRKIIVDLSDDFVASHPMEYSEEGEKLLNSVQEAVMRKAIKLELNA